MRDWKGKIDDYLDKDKVVVQKEPERNTVKMFGKTIDVDKFCDENRCLVCRKKSTGPKYGSIGGMDESGQEWSGSILIIGGLTKCNECENLFCDRHIHRSICKSCAKKL